MRKAGFLAATELSFDPSRQVRLASLGAPERARAAAEVLGLPLVDEELAPCWCCQSAETTSNTAGACWPGAGFEATACSCAIERKPSTRLAA